MAEADPPAPPIRPPFTGTMARRYVSCDHCGAQTGDRCRTLVGAGTYPHHARWTALKALADAVAAPPTVR